MSISPVSFGKVVLVKGSIKDACKIAEIANRKPKTKLDKQVKRVINDISKGPAFVYSFNPSEDKTYILSGKEGKDFWKSHCTAKAEVDFINTYYSNKPSAKTEIQNAWENHAANVDKIISSVANRPIIGVEHNKQGYISAINVLG